MPLAGPPTLTASPSAASPPSMPTPKPPPSKLLLPTKPGPATSATARPAKHFSIQEWGSANEGEKILIYGKSGMGKTTLASLAPNPVFIGLDDGGRKIIHPKTGKRLPMVPGVSDFQDLRDAIRQPGLLSARSSFVIDTVTKLESLMEPYIFANFKTKGGTAKNMRDYGWDGPAHLLDCFRLLLTDLDGLVRAGHNVILLAQLAQISVANSEGLDYLEDGPKLQHNKQYSVRTELCEWADHVFRIGYTDMTVIKEDAKAKAGKITGDGTRCIYTGGAQHYMAKTRPIGTNRVPPLVSFDTPETDDLWQFMFNGATAQETK